MVAIPSSQPTVAEFARLVDPIGVAAAVKASEDPNFIPRPRIFEEFSLEGRVGVVSKTMSSRSSPKLTATNR